jgi:arsenate reductase-like glutaredoxin family protein
MMHTSQTSAANLNSTAVNSYGNTAEPSIKDLMEIIKEQGMAIKILNDEISRIYAKAHKDKNQSTDTVSAIKQAPKLKIVKKGITSKAPKILVFGVTKLSKLEMLDIIQNRLLNSYNIHIKKSDVIFMTADNKDKLRKESPVEKLKAGNYDYLIVGPQPHSVKGKNAKYNWTTFLKNKEIETEAFEEYTKPLSKTDLLKVCDRIGRKNFAPTFPGKQTLSIVS